MSNVLLAIVDVTESVSTAAVSLQSVNDHLRKINKSAPTALSLQSQCIEIEAALALLPDLLTDPTTGSLKTHVQGRLVENLDRVLRYCKSTVSLLNTLLHGSGAVDNEERMNEVLRSLEAQSGTLSSLVEAAVLSSTAEIHHFLNGQQYQQLAQSVTYSAVRLGIENGHIDHGYQSMTKQEALTSTVDTHTDLSSAHPITSHKSGAGVSKEDLHETDDFLDNYRINGKQILGLSAGEHVGESKKTGSPVVIRRVFKSDNAQAEAARREIKLLSSVNETCFPALIDSEGFPASICWIVEYQPGESIRQLIETHGPPPEWMIKSMVTQLFAGLASLFYAGFAHLRICDETVFIDNNSQLTIRDFQYCHEYDDQKVDDLYARIEEKYGSDVYVAPEVFANRIYNARKANIWSCGVLLYYFSTGQIEKLSSLGHPAFEDKLPTEEEPRRGSLSHGRKLSVASKEVLRIVHYPNRLAVPQWARDILSKMLQTEPLRRAELIECAARVPKEIASKETRPLMELAWLDYKIHVGPHAGMNDGAKLSSSSSSFISAVSDISNPFSSLMNRRRKSSVTQWGGATNVVQPRRQTIAVPQTTIYQGKPFVGGSGW